MSCILAPVATMLPDKPSTQSSESASDLISACLLDTFVDNNTNGMLSYIVHDARPAVVCLVRHTLLHGSITLQNEIKTLS